MAVILNTPDADRGYQSPIRIKKRDHGIMPVHVRKIQLFDFMHGGKCILNEHCA
jgi:hypothetical protein